MKNTIVSLIFALISFSGSAQEVTAPKLTNPVMDQGQMISPGLEQKLNQALRQLRQQGGSQIVVATVPSLKGLPIEEYSIQLVDQWKIGKAREDNGVLLLLAKKDRKLRIEVGQGLEGRVTDAHSKRIISDVMTPLLKAQRLDQAIFYGTSNIVKRTDPSFNFAEAVNIKREFTTKPKKQKTSWLRLLIYFILFLIFMGGNRGGMAGFFLGAALGGGRRVGFGGGGIGGFSGGGGGFSGGGASGDW